MKQLQNPKPSSLVIIVIMMIAAGVLLVTIHSMNARPPEPETPYDSAAKVYGDDKEIQ